MRATAPFDFNAITQPLYSRGRKEIKTMDHIRELLRDFRRITSFAGTLDGELYFHDKTVDNFQEIMKACKKYRKGTSELVDYYVYELVDAKLNALDRYEALKRHISRYNASLSSNVKVQLHYVTQHLVFSKEEADTIHEKYIAEGYEGTMWKPVDCMYREGARSMDLLKHKDFDEGEFEVRDIIPMDAYPEQGKALLYSKKANGTFYATPSMSHSRRAKLLENKEKWIGGMATVKYFGLTDKGKPRIATLKWITKENDEHERYRFGTKDSTKLLD
jgi:ATP-dependent DNA ligase